MAKGNRITHKAILFWIAIIAITLGLVIAIIANQVHLAKTKVDDLKELEVTKEEMLDYSTKTYVFLYDSSVDTDYFHEIEKFVLNYATKANRENGVKIYTLDVTKEENTFLVNDHEEVVEKINSVSDYEYIRIKSKRIPILLVVENRRVTYYKDGLNSIKQELQTEIDKEKWFSIITFFLGFYLTKWVK